MIRKIIGILFIVCAIALGITLRVLGLDYTEGQLLVRYWMQWLVFVWFLFMGAYLLLKE